MNVLISLVLAGLAVYVAIQNPGVVKLLLGPFEITASAGIILIACFALGMLVGMSTSIPSGWRAYRMRRTSEKAG
ncbi:MAG: LapA family protein [Rhodothermales bacterium]